MLHVCRDFISLGIPTSLYSGWVAQYLQVIFMRAVLGFSVVGQTNFNIDGSTLWKGHGVAGSLNQGAGNEYCFAPDGYTVSTADLNRILALKSPANGMVNSGLFRITGVDTTNNWFIINYRSGDLPPAETGMTWAVYADESVWQGLINTTGNGNSSVYSGRGSATQNRIVLQSPSALQWQVRVAIENSTDCADGGVAPSQGFGAGATTTVGYGGDTLGDFQPGGQHTHMMMYLNKHDSTYYGNTVGFWPVGPGGGTQARYYMWGDDTTGSVFAAARNVVGGSDSFIHFGLPEQEELPLPPKNAQRLFVMGANALGNGGTNGIYWASGPSTQRGGMSFGLSGQPISCIYSLYNPLSQGYFPGNNPLRFSNYAADCPYLGATELLPVDLLAGTLDNQSSYYTGGPTLILEVRRLGRAPFVRLGRGNYGNFQTSSDAQRAWFHLADGMYMPWQGSILP